MKNKLLNILLILIFGAGFVDVSRQEEEDRYVPETDPLVLEKLDKWQDRVKDS